MALLQHGALQPNNWRFVGDDAAVPADEPVTVSLKRWQAEAETLRGRNTPIGTLHNPDAAHMFATINKIPPVGFSYVQEGLVPMADANGEVIAIKVFTETALRAVITAD